MRGSERRTTTVIGHTARAGTGTGRRRAATGKIDRRNGDRIRVEREGEMRKTRLVYQIFNEK